jgi:hypothetical protein
MHYKASRVHKRQAWMGTRRRSSHIPTHRRLLFNQWRLMNCVCHSMFAASDPELGNNHRHKGVCRFGLPNNSTSRAGPECKQASRLCWLWDSEVTLGVRMALTLNAPDKRSDRSVGCSTVASGGPLRGTCQHLCASERTTWIF